MYLHKEGCEYYRAVLGYVTLHTKAVSNNNDLTTDSVKNVGPYNMFNELTKLHSHIKDSLEHIHSEDNVLKNFAEKVNTHIGRITDPKTAELFQIVQMIGVVEEEFKTIRGNIEEALELMKQGGREGRKLLNVYDYIHTRLNNIYTQSQRIARDLTALIQSLQKETELIKKEEIVATDFQKNMMSWF